MAFYARIGSDGEIIAILRNPTPVPADAVLLTKKEIFSLLSEGPAGMRRISEDVFDLAPAGMEDPWPTDPIVRKKLLDARYWLSVTNRVAQVYIEESLAMQLGSTEITSTTLPAAFALKVLEFRAKLRGVLSKRMQPSDTVPAPPDD